VVSEGNLAALNYDLAARVNFDTTVNYQYTDNIYVMINRQALANAQGTPLEFNLKLHKAIIQLLQVNSTFTLSEKYNPIDEKDYRRFFNSKKESLNTKLKENTYIQVFTDRMPFQPNLSIVDLLFNEGPNSLEYLSRITSV